MELTKYDIRLRINSIEDVELIYAVLDKFNEPHEYPMFNHLEEFICICNNPSPERKWRTFRTGVTRHTKLKFVTINELIEILKKEKHISINEIRLLIYSREDFDFLESILSLFNQELSSYYREYETHLARHDDGKWYSLRDKYKERKCIKIPELIQMLKDEKG